MHAVSLAREEVRRQGVAQGELRLMRFRLPKSQVIPRQVKAQGSSRFGTRDQGELRLTHFRLSRSQGHDRQGKAQGSFRLDEVHQGEFRLSHFRLPGAQVPER